MSTGAAKKRLSREAVIEAAIDFADTQGLDELSMRKLAEALGVTPMALYNHVANREEMIDGMVEHLVASIPAPQHGKGWKVAVRSKILAAREVMNAHPWAPDAIETRTSAGHSVLHFMDELMALMFEGGLSADLVHHAMHALSTRMWGFNRDVLPTPQMPKDPEQYATAMADYQREYPAIIRMATDAPHTGAGCDADAEFEFALDILLDAFERLDSQGWVSVGG
ncbi:TetR/AcrR family transcriptional regulator [Corynebacterium sp. S7]